LFGRKKSIDMSNYFIAKDGKQTGPFEESEVLRQVDAGVLSANDLCWREGMGNWEPIAGVLTVPSAQSSPPPISGTPPSVVEKSPLFLHIPISRLILMSIVSFSVYEAYWIYKNWRYVKERDNLNIRPFWRGWFGIFYCHSLLRRIHGDTEARSVQMPSFSPGGLATGWVVLLIFANLLSRAPSIAATIISVFIPSFLCLVPVQNYINAVTQRRNPGQSYHRWSSGHVVCLVFGLIIWTLLLIGLAAE
jgi:hypothetical protein